MSIFTHNQINHQAECWKLFLTWWVWEVLRSTSKSFRFLVCHGWFALVGGRGRWCNVVLVRVGVGYCGELASVFTSGK
jgi:hypothetical protein